MQKRTKIVGIMRLCFLLLFVPWLSFSFCGCESDEEVSIPYVDVDEDDDFDGVEVYYKEENGVKIIPVTINGIGVDMIFDTGCSSTLISMAEANYLYTKGLLSDDDILGLTAAQIADGSIVPNVEIVIRELIIADEIECHDIHATVCMNEDAPLLLGNEVLNTLPSYEVDNVNKVIVFHE